MEQGFLDAVQRWLTSPMFSLGDSPITALRLMSMILVLLAAWWVSVVLEASLRQVSKRADPVQLSASALYTLERIAHLRSGSLRIEHAQGGQVTQVGIAHGEA